MRNSGLSNRFPPAVREWWHGWYACNVCSENGWDALHHIVSPSTRHYVKGKHNESVFNSCPIHNHKCHVGNEAYLFNDKNLSNLLFATAETIEERGGWKLTENDRVFLRVYAHLYRGGNSRNSPKAPF